MSKPNVRAFAVPRIDLGFRLNHLLNRHTKLGKTKDDKVSHGLILPSEKQIGSGMVVIIGDPGSGKSTLTLQIAVAAAKQGCDSAYISLEEERERVLKKADIFGWKSYLWPAEFPAVFETESIFVPGQPVAPEPTAMRDALKGCRSKSNPHEGKILLPGLLPRPIAQGESRLGKFFWEQYRQIEFLVRSAAEHNKKAETDKRDYTGIRLIAIDSLNMLGVEHQNREMIHRLFDLFRQNHIMGVFTVEGSSDVGFDSTMGDVVFKFSRDDSSGYEILLLECAKSRFSARTQGPHPYKIIAPQDRNIKQPQGEFGVVVYPSPHAVVAATEGYREPRPGEFPFGWSEDITRHLLRNDLRRGNVVALAGSSGTFKTQIALNFLLHGIAMKESVLYLRLHTPERLNLKQNMMPYAEPILLRDVGNRTAKFSKAEGHVQRQQMLGLRDLVTASESEGQELQKLVSKTKAVISIHKAQKRSPARLIVVDFCTGMLLAEEFIDIIMRLVFDNRFGQTITRVVLDDVGVIGASYPLLRRSITTGDLFLSSFVHVMKNHGMDVLVVGTTGELTESNFMVHQACSLADAVLRTTVGTIFGDKQVLLAGDGMAARDPKRGQTPPIVLLPGLEKRTLTPNAELLDEFVGFEIGRIERPGIMLHLYAENDIQKRYNVGLLKRLQERYGKPLRSRERGFLGVGVTQFEPGDIARLDPFYGRNAQDKPRDHTAVTMIDEFEANANPDIDKYHYQRNVLLIAYRTDLPGTKPLRICTDWKHIRSILNGLPLPLSHGRSGASIKASYYGRRFCYDCVAPETLACLVLSALYTGKGIKWRAKNKPDLSATLTTRIQRRVIEEFEALHDLMFHHSWNDEERKGIAEGRKPSVREKLLTSDAAVYVCWYSQLRELIIREPYLAPRLTVRPLPCGGFRGDWYLQVEPGSVSRRLGTSIVESLLSPSEDFERFRTGVCLSVRVGPNPCPRLAWAGAKSNLTMQRVVDIWKLANRRSTIPQYHHFNRLLYGIGDMLAGNCFDLRDSTAAIDIPDLVSRLPQMVADLCDRWQEHAETGISALISRHEDAC